MIDSFKDFLQTLNTKLEDEIKKTVDSMTEDERRAYEKRRKAIEQTATKVAQAIIDRLTDDEDDENLIEFTDFGNAHKESEHKPFEGFKDTVTTTKEKTNDNQERSRSLANIVSDRTKKNVQDTNDKLYKTLCKDIDCALLNGEYQIVDSKYAVIRFEDKYRGLNSYVINSVVDHYIEDEDFLAVDITTSTERKIDGKNVLVVTLEFPTV